MGIRKYFRDWFKAAAEIDVQRAKETRQPPNHGKSYTLVERQIVCTHCQGTLFLSRVVSLHSRFASFFDLEWLGGAATTLCCINCGHLEFFQKTPTPSLTP